MAKKRHTTEQIISKLREAEVELAKGLKVPQVCRKLEAITAGERSMAVCGWTRPSA